MRDAVVVSLSVFVVVVAVGCRDWLGGGKGCGRDSCCGVDGGRGGDGIGGCGGVGGDDVAMVFMCAWGSHDG